MTNPYLLLMAVLFLLWLFGVTDVFKHLRKPKNRKMDWVAFLSVAGANGIAALFFGFLLLKPVSPAEIEFSVAFIQNEGWLFVILIFGCLAGIWVLGWNLINDFLRFRMSSTLILSITFLVILFANPPFDSTWRVWAAGLFFAFLTAEIVLQLLTIPGWLPSHPIFQSGMYHQYGRIYQNEEGFTNSIVNKYGLHQPNNEVNFDPGVRRIVLLGGSYIQGFQVSKMEHLAQLLEEQIRKKTAAKVQVFALSIPDVGIGVYMHDLLFDTIIEKFQPNEVIFFQHASSDFQCESAQFSDPFLFDLNDSTAELRPGGERIRHAFQHIVIRGYHDTLDPLRIIKTHLLLPKLIHAIIGIGAKPPVFETPETDDPITAFTGYIIRRFGGRPFYYQSFIGVPSIRVDGMRNYLFEKEASPEAAKSFAVTKSLYHQIYNYLDAKKIKSRLVTIPALSPKFLEQEGEWSPVIGDYDLLSTERVSQDIAKSGGVDFLSMWGQFERDQLTTSQIKRLYYQDGQGHFTPAGHRYFFESIYAAFYESESNASQ